jgi:hypothetical protein
MISRVYDTCQSHEQIYKFIVNDEVESARILDDSLSWLYESGFTVDTITSSAVIVGTNKLVSWWNNKIQSLNTNEERIFLSKDSLADIDDDNNIISGMLSTRFLNCKNHASAPPHELRLKVNDVCILTR